MKNNSHQLVLFMKALADDTRLKIFHMLEHGELCACDILAEFTITQPTLSYHMKILSESGLVHSRKDGVWMKYSINVENVLLLKQFFDQLGDSVSVSVECEKC